MKIRIRTGKDNVLSLCIALYYAIAVLNRMTQTLFPSSSALKLIIRIGTYTVILVILYKLIKSKSNILALVISEVVVGLVFAFSIFMGFLGDTDWSSVYQLIATTYIPLAIAAYNIIDRKELLKYLYGVSLISVPVLIVASIFSYGNWDTSYDMTLGYTMVFTVLILLADYIVNTRLTDILLAILMSLFILFVGSRGPFICILTFIAMELLLSKQYSKRRKAYIISALVILSAVLVLNIDSILTFVYQLSVNLGFDSRSLYLLMQGEAVSHDSGRSELQIYYTALINKRPIFGYGVMGNWISDGMYPHNIILELIMSFGYPLGLLAFIIVLIIMLKGIREEDKYYSALAVLFVSYCCHLFVSGTYLKVWQFFVAIALCIPHNLRFKLTVNRNENAQ